MQNWVFHFGKFHKIRSSTLSCDFTGNSSRHLHTSFAVIMTTGNGIHWKCVFNKICASKKKRVNFTTAALINRKWQFYFKMRLKCFAYHFLLVNVWGDLHLLVLLPGLVSVGTVMELTVTFIHRIKLSNVICSELRPGGRPPTSLDCWGSEFVLNTSKTCLMCLFNMYWV